jgi:hypothetical protein
MQGWIARMGAVALVGLIVWQIVPPPTRVHSQTAEVAASASKDLQVISTLLPTGTQQIVMVDVAGRTMAVYHIEPSSGKLQLKSVRNCQWDLRMEHFNGQTPLPSEIRQVQP